MANEGQYDSQTNIEIEDYEKEILAEREFAKIYNVVAGVSSVNGYTGDVILTTSDLENTSDYQTGTEVQSAIDTAISGKQDVLTAGNNISISGNTISAVDTTYTAGTGLDLSGTTFSADTTVLATKAELATVATSGNYNDLVDKPTIPDVSNFITKDVNNLTYYTTSTDMQTAINSAVGAETQNRELADTNLQNQIDAITVSSDVIDVLGTYQDLLNYDTSHVKANDIIKVLQDSTHNNAMSYYRWVITSNVGAWVYVGSEGPYYTKSETDTLVNAKQNEITSTNKLASDLVDDTNQTNKFVTTAEKQTWNNKIDSSALTNYVTNTDYAGPNKVGVIRTNPDYGTSITSVGALISATKTYQQYQDTTTNNMFISKGTLENVLTGKGLKPIVELTQSEYDALTTKDSNTYYYIVEE